jgi:hypothetical protein
MVAVFLPVLPVGVVLWLHSRDVTRSSYVAVAGTKKTWGEIRYDTICYSSGPPWPAPHHMDMEWIFSGTC